MKRSPMLKLSQEERQIVIEAAAETFMVRPSDGVWGAIMRGFDSLPTNRRPSLQKAKTWNWLLRSVQERIAQKRQETKSDPDPIDLGTVSTEILLQEVAGRLIADVVEKLKEAIQAQTKDDVLHKAEERARKTRILIVGLLARQEKLIKTEFGSVLDVRFIKPNGSHINSQFESVCRNSDHVFGMTSFMSHNAEYAIRSLNGSYTRISGGLTELKDKLLELYVE